MLHILLIALSFPLINCTLIDSVTNFVDFSRELTVNVGFAIREINDLARLLFTGDGNDFNGAYLDIIMKSILPHLDEALVNTLRTARMVKLEQRYYKRTNMNPYFGPGLTQPFRTPFVNITAFQSPNCAGLDQFLGILTTATTLISGYHPLDYTSDIEVVVDPLRKGTFSKFYFFGPKNKSSPYAVLDYEDWRPSDDSAEDFTISRRTQRILKPFMVEARTFVICHGWFDRYYSTGWMDKLKDLILLREGNVNIIIVDWHKIAFNAFTNKVSASARIVGSEVIACIANVIVGILNGNRRKYKKNIRDFLPNVHFIGHSFGGQVLGRAGNGIFRIYSKPGSVHQIANITVVDIADQCYFRSDMNIHYQDVLSTNSAQRVKVIHTNGDFAGTYKKYGHVDIFVDGAATLPGCLLRIDAITNYWQLALLIVCSHVKVEAIVTTFFSHQTNHTENCYPVAIDCVTYGDFISGNCYQCEDPPGYGDAYGTCQLTGFDSQFDHVGYEEPIFPAKKGNLSLSDPATPPLTRSFFTSLSPQHPYCQYTYRIEINGDLIPASEYATLTLIGRNGRRFTQQVNFVNGAVFLFFISSLETIPSPFSEAIIEHYNPVVTRDSYAFFLFDLRINYTSHLNPNVQEFYYQRLCTDFYERYPTTFETSRIFPGTEKNMLPVPVLPFTHANKVTFKSEFCENYDKLIVFGSQSVLKTVGKSRMKYYNKNVCYYDRDTGKYKEGSC